MIPKGAGAALFTSTIVSPLPSNICASSHRGSVEHHLLIIGIIAAIAVYI
jgi:hypothetical protein